MGRTGFRDDYTATKRSRMKKKKKTPSLTVAYLRNKILWPVFSQYIRFRDANEDGITQCATCGKRAFWKGEGMQAGHFNPGRHNAILFDERGVNTQCYHCNVGLKGAPREYNAFMLEKYGQEIIDELDALAKTTRQFFKPELISMVADYTARLEELKKKKKYEKNT